MKDFRALVVSVIKKLKSSCLKLYKLFHCHKAENKYFNGIHIFNSI